MDRTAGPLILLLATATFLGAVEARADESHTHSHHDDDAHHDDHEPTPEVRQAGAHSHGNATLAVAIEGADVFIELDTPLYNLLGFEHTPQSPEEIDRQREVSATLASPERLFALNPEAGCQAQADHGDDPLAALAPHAEHDDGHGPDHDISQSNHRDVIAQFLFTCESPDRISDIDVRLFEAFPLLTQLDAVFLGENAQRSIRLTKDNHRIATDR